MTFVSRHNLLVLSIVASIFFTSYRADAQQKSRVQSADRKAGETQIEAASAMLPDGKVVDFELGTLYVPENRSDTSSRIIGTAGQCYKM